MAQFQSGRERSFKMTNDDSAHQYYIVKYDTAANSVVLASAATDNICGILTIPGKAAGDNCTVTMVPGNGTAKIAASAAISKGAFVTAESGGRAVSTTNSGDRVIGQAMEAAAAAGDIIEVKLMYFKY